MGDIKNSLRFIFCNFARRLQSRGNKGKKKNSKLKTDTYTEVYKFKIKRIEDKITGGLKLIFITFLREINKSMNYGLLKVLKLLSNSRMFVPLFCECLQLIFLRR